MKFSIITATYNSQKTIKKTLDSILNQTFREFEYIIIDGNSSDKTIEIVKSYQALFLNKGIPFNWISEKDSGIYQAWNKGVKMAKGSWISFLGSDDEYLENAIELYNNTLNNNKSYDLIYSNVKVINNDKEVNTIDGVWAWKTFKRYMNIAHVGAFHNKNYFNKYGLFDESYKVAGDYELLLRAGEKLITKKISKVTALMDAGGISNNQTSKAFKETFIAKHTTGKVNYIICLIDFFIAHIKFNLKKLLYAIIR
jgi:glycosyltransferase involved in cell wall biosynthesis